MKRFIIIITMLAYFSACTKTTMIPLESVEPVACQPVYGVVLADDRQVIFSSTGGRYVAQRQMIEGEVNGSDSVSYRLENIQNVLMALGINGDSVVAVPVDEYKSSQKKWNKLAGYHISAAVKRDGHPIRFSGESGRLNCADYSLYGVLTTGDRLKLRIDSVNTVILTSSPMSRRTLILISVAASVAFVVLVYVALANWEPGPIDPGWRL